MSSGEAGLIISAALSMARFQFGIRQSAEMENQMNSVARIIEYGKLKSEAPFESSKGKYTFSRAGKSPLLYHRIVTKFDNN